MNNFTSQFNQLAKETWTNTSQVLTQLNEQQNLIALRINSYCGPGLWHRVPFPNMREPSQ